VSLHGNHYRVECRYDPTDVTRIAIYHHDVWAGDATPEYIGIHVDPKLRVQTQPEPGPATGSTIWKRWLPTTPPSCGTA
jgi:hypothetical protein